MKTIKIITKGKSGINIPRSIDTGDYTQDISKCGTLTSIIFHDIFQEIGVPKIIKIDPEIQDVYVLNEKGETIHRLT